MRSADKTKENLERLFNERLKPHLESVEKDRIWIKKRLIFTSVIAFFLIFLIGIIPNEIMRWIIIVISLISLLWLVGTGIVKYYLYRHQFKEKVVNEIVKFINPQYHYDAYQFINVFDFNKAKLFAKGERCVGDDLVSGRIQNVPFHYSEIKVGDNPQNNGNSKQSYFFRGLFFYADFNKDLKEETYVFPDIAEKFLGKMGQKLQAKNKKGDLVKLENAAFEKEFVVYSTSQQEARYVLTPTMMEAILKIYQKHHLKLHFSFVGSRINCAIKFNKNLFEPRVMSSGVSFRDVEYMYELFGLIETIISEMNLNTRIWTKD